MKTKFFFLLTLSCVACSVSMPAFGQTTASRPARQTIVSIDGQAFLINGKPTYSGKSYKGMKIEGLLFNARLVQGIFDDRNPETRSLWNYPDGAWDPDRNTREFIAAMPSWRQCGLLSFTINLQGGSPQGYSKKQPWINSAILPDGSLDPAYMKRLEAILNKADELGMAPIVGIFYKAQSDRLGNEEVFCRAADAFVDWLVEKGYTNVMVEIANEGNGFKSNLISTDRVTELIRRVQRRSEGRLPTPAGRLLVGESYWGNIVPSEAVVEASDFLLLHGNGVGKPERIAEMVRQTRMRKTYRGQPILFNEDDHYDFDKPQNNFVMAVSEYASWGFFDYRHNGEPFEQGYQSVPVDWSIRSDRKKGFFRLLAEITGNPLPD
jgi:hypothetical protein